MCSLIKSTPNNSLVALYAEIRSDSSAANADWLCFSARNLLYCFRKLVYNRSRNRRCWRFDSLLFGSFYLNAVFLFDFSDYAAELETKVFMRSPRWMLNAWQRGPRPWVGYTSPEWLWLNSRRQFS